MSKRQNDKLIGLVNELADLRYEADQVRRNFHTTWDNGALLMDGDHHFLEKNTTSKLERFTLNKIFNSVVTFASVLTEQRPRMVITPTEYGDQKVWYIQSSVGAQILMQNNGQAPEGFEVEQLTGDAPLLVPQIQSLMQTMGLGEDAFIGLDDSLVADAIHDINDKMWDQAGADWVVGLGTQAKLTYGHSPLLWRWSAEKKRWTVEAPHVKNVWFDPNSAYGGEGEYAVLGQRMDRNEAVRKFGSVTGSEKIIDNSVFRGGGNQENESVTGLGDPYDPNYQRDMVDVYTAWRRDQDMQIDVSVEDALEQRLVAYNDEGFELPNGGGATKPKSKNWPKVAGKGIRQWVVIGNELVDDRQCPYRDIPITCDVNIPRQYSPYGYGEPEKLVQLNRAINRLMGILVEHTKHFQSPMEVMPASMADAQKGQQNRYSYAGKSITIPDDVWIASGGKPGIFHYPPPLNRSYVEFMQILLAEFDEFSGNTQALQGAPQTAGQSGAAIEALQSAGRGIIGYRAMWMERALVGAGKLTTGMIVDFLPDAEFEKYVGKFPPAVLDALRTRVKTLAYDVDAEVGAGKGANARRKFGQSMALYQATGGVVPSVKTLLEDSDTYDIDEEMRRVAEEQGAPQEEEKGEGEDES